jgi:hypothetical protein
MLKVKRALTGIHVENNFHCPRLKSIALDHIHVSFVPDENKKQINNSRDLCYDSIECLI